jgi:hypothetical protein
LDFIIYAFTSFCFTESNVHVFGRAMARRIKQTDIEPILNAADRWIKDCLITNGSIFSSEKLWTPENMAEVKRAFVDNPDEGDENFLTKLKGQMQSVSPPAQKLMAEMLWVILLFPSNLKVETKLQQIRAIWELSKSQLPNESPMLNDRVLNGIGSAGPAYNRKRWQELAYLISLVEGLKKANSDERRKFLTDYDTFLNWIKDVPEKGYRQFRHMLRYFAFPDVVERMASNKERRTVLQRFGVGSEEEIADWDDRKLDQALLQLRQKLQNEYPNEVLDFYEDPLVGKWRRDSEQPSREAGEDVSVNSEIVSKCWRDLQAANFRCEKDFLQRLIAALFAKRFVILTGLAGSGKTKLAQALARWATPAGSIMDPFTPGNPLSNSYRIMDADRIAIEFWNREDEKVVLPRRLIEEWADFLETHPSLSDIPSKEVREEFLKEYDKRHGAKFARHAIFWDSHLKPAALALIGARKKTAPQSRCYEVVAVGADWTTSEHILGYPDGIDKHRYVRTRTLDLILRAVARPDAPHFLILDEMNLSHIERYFADLLSAIESGEPLHLHSDKGPGGAPAVRDAIPGELSLPSNLFIIGTVNVDETTYMFSPKVLDRANVLEFRVSDEDLREFLKQPVSVDFGKLDGNGATSWQRLLKLQQESLDLSTTKRGMFESELLLFFGVLQSANAEFGFRVAKEGSAFLSFHQFLSPGDWDFRVGMDALILQKLLPKLHGSRNTLEPVLWVLATLCFYSRTWQLDEATGEFAHLKILREETAKAKRMEDESLDPLGLKPNGDRTYPSEGAYYRLSFEKIVRMLARLRANGFTSFAEA